MGRRKKAPAKRAREKKLNAPNEREYRRRQAFVTLYCHPDYARNATRAALDAGYSNGHSDAAKVTGHRLLQDPAIADAINDEIQRQVERTRIDSNEIVKQWARLGRVDIRDLLEVKMVKQGRSLRPQMFLKADSLDQLSPDITAAIKDIEVRKDGLRVRLHDKTAVLRDVAKHLQMFRDPMATQRPQFSPQQRVELLLALFKTLARRRQDALAPGTQKAG